MSQKNQPKKITTFNKTKPNILIIFSNNKQKTSTDRTEKYPFFEQNKNFQIQQQHKNNQRNNHWNNIDQPDDNFNQIFLNRK